MDVGLVSWVGVRLRGTHACRCGILYVPMLGVVFYAGLVSMTSSSYPSPCSPLFFRTIVHSRDFFCSVSRVLLCVRVRTHGAFVFCGTENRSVKCGQPLWCVQNDDEISTSPRRLNILYKVWIRKTK